MTGFGRCEIVKGDRHFNIEIKTVNHRYLDISIKMPKKFNSLEAKIRNMIKDSIQRGKVDVFISYKDIAETKSSIKYNKEIAEEYMRYLNDMAQEFSLKNEVSVASLSRYPEVFTMEEPSVDEAEIWIILELTLREAIKLLTETRHKEGDNLKENLVLKLDNMFYLIDCIERHLPEMIVAYKEKLEEKIKDLIADVKIDDNRLLMEVTIFADKVCIDEEIVRLKSHIETTKETLLEGGCIGRKLDFIAQELNREANTILSKANDLLISKYAIELKTEIEKVREQIQNIE